LSCREHPSNRAPLHALIFGWGAVRAAGLEHDEERDAARQALRGFLDKIVIPRGEGLLQVVGNVGSMFAAAQSRSLSRNAVGNVGRGGGI